MLKGGVIMDVVTAEHAKIAEDGAAVPGRRGDRLGRFRPEGGGDASGEHGTAQSHERESSHGRRDSGHVQPSIGEFRVGPVRYRGRLSTAEFSAMLHCVSNRAGSSAHPLTRNPFRKTAPVSIARVLTRLRSVVVHSV